MEKIELDLLIKTSESVNSLKDIKSSLKDLKDAASQFGEGSEEFNRVTAAAGELKDKLDDVNQAINAKKGTGFEKLGGELSILKDKLLTLDFKGINDSIGRLGTQFKSISFGDITKGVKDVGGVFLNLGKALLANPIFLIAGVIVGIGAALFALKDKVKIIGDAFKFLGDIIGDVIQFFKDLSDAIGLSSFAAEEAAEKQIEAAKKTQSAVEERYDNEIKYAQAAGKSTFELEKKKQEAVRESIKAQILGLSELLVLNGKLTEEQLKQLEELKKAYKDTLVEEKVATIKNQKEIDDNAKEAAKKAAEERKQQIKDIADYQKQIDKEVADNKAETQKLLVEQNQAQIDKDIENGEQLKVNAQADSDFNVAVEQQEQQRIAELKRSFREQEQAEKLASAQEDIGIAMDGVKAVQGISDLAFAIQEANKKKGSKSAEEDAKKQFKINKALQLAGAAINGAQAITTSLAAAPPVIGVAPNPAGIAALISIGLTTAATIAKIAATQYNPGSSSAPTPSTPTMNIPSGGSGSEPSAPQPTRLNDFGLFGTGGNNNLGPGATQMAPQQVSVVEITKKQNAVQAVELDAQLG